MTSKPIVFMLSGQGSQYYHMGKDLYDSSWVFNRELTLLDEMVEDRLGISVVKTIYNRDKLKSDPFDDSLLSSISIYLVELALAKTLKHEGIEPDILIGVSFGTFVSAVIANCLKEEKAIELIAQHGQLFDRACEKGSMLAVLGSPSVFFNNPELRDLCDLVSKNAGESFVLSHLEKNADAVRSILSSENYTYVTMPVSRPYHSRWIENAKPGFAQIYGQLNYDCPKIPIVCTNAVENLVTINSDVLWKVVRGGIHFRETIDKLESQGEYNYIDIGPSGTSATSLKYMLSPDSKSQVFPVLSPLKRAENSLEELTHTLRSN